MKRIAILEDNVERVAAMRRAIERALSDSECFVFGTAPEMIEWLQCNLKGVSVLSLDHDLETPVENGPPGSGRDVSNFLCTQAPNCGVVIHSSNAVAAADMRVELKEAGWSCERVSPYRDLEWIEHAWIREIQRQLAGN